MAAGNRIGRQEITGLGLYNYKARFYSPGLGRFISPDSVTPGGPEGLNRYSYVNNSPVNATDPTGHECVKWDGNTCTKHDDNLNGNPSYPTWNPSLLAKQGAPPVCTRKKPPYTWPRIPDNVAANIGEQVISIGKMITDESGGLDAIVPSPGLAFWVGLYSQGYQDSSADMEPGEMALRAGTVGIEHIVTDLASTGMGLAFATASAGNTSLLPPLPAIAGGVGFVGGEVVTTVLASRKWDRYNEKVLFPSFHSIFGP